MFVRGINNVPYIKQRRAGTWTGWQRLGGTAIDAPAAAIHEVERQMRINEDVLRYMTIAVEAHEEGPSAMMQKRDRDDRPRRDGDRQDRGPREDRGPRAPREGGFGDREDRPRRPREDRA